MMRDARLTAREPKKGMAYLVNVKQNEQEVESPYSNTLKCIMDCFEALAQYEETGLSPNEIKRLQAVVEAAREFVKECVIKDCIPTQCNDCRDAKDCDFCDYSFCIIDYEGCYLKKLRKALESVEVGE